MDALRSFILRIDFSGRKVSFLRSVPDDAGTPMAIEWHQGRPFVHGVIVGSERCSFLLDTGYAGDGESGSLRPDTFRRLLGSRRLALLGSAPAHGARSDGAVERGGILIGTMRVAAFTHGGLVFVEDTPVDGAAAVDVLGIAYLARYVLTFDFPSSTVWFKPNEHFGRLDTVRRLDGLWLCAQGRAIVVAHVAAGTPAAHAGVRRGDVLELVDGTPVSRMDQAELVLRLSTGMAKPLTLSLRRPETGALARFVVAPYVQTTGAGSN